MKKEELITRLFNARQSRAIHPWGEFDNAGRWYPDDDEHCSCCDSIRSPSRSYPYSLMQHCRSKKHIRNLVEKGWRRPLKSLLLSQAANGSPEQATPKRACPDGIAYKLVAIGDDGRLYSVYDGSPWLLGIARSEIPRQGHNGGLYVYESLRAALGAPFPEDSVYGAEDAPRAVVKCRVAGRYCRYGTSDDPASKLAFESVTPINIELIEYESTD